MTTLRCDGWWEQSGYGRQPMEDLTLRIDEGSVHGSGHDIVGAFTMGGTIDAGAVSIVKQYIDAHEVLYVGTFDGEGMFRGRWSIWGVGGEWMIRVRTAIDQSDEIQEL